MTWEERVEGKETSKKPSEQLRRTQTIQRYPIYGAGKAVTKFWTTKAFSKERSHKSSNTVVQCQCTCFKC